jgi:cobalt-zinc-cadmium resistance protein CzcA
LGDLRIPLPNGTQIPLKQVAEIQLKEGPALINREEGKRRIVIGVNARGRDVQSIVQDIQQRLDSSLELPPGYLITYGGAFENLQDAQARLLVAVPVALALIFLLLYITFGKIRLALLIFTAIPLSAIGGIFALELRGMPFSISAGVGFIALFRVAVLNGIVLVSQFEIFKENKELSLMERLQKSTALRFRPVLTTALVAALGFLPMMLSTQAGAEVQQPLATVVVGGLLTATLLTLYLLPMLYALSEQSFSSKK